MELVARKTTQLGKYGLTVWANVDVGIGRVKGDSLIRIENKRPRAGSVLKVVERAGLFQRRQPRQLLLDLLFVSNVVDSEEIPHGTAANVRLRASLRPAEGVDRRRGRRFA